MKTSRSAFTLVELMVSTSILVLMMVILLQMTSQTANTWRYGAAKAEQFQESRKAFETMTRRISEATLNTYWDYYRPPTAPTTDFINPPSDYVRQSDLRFRVVRMPEINFQSTGVFRPGNGIFFQAPIGMVEEYNTPLAKLDNLLNSWGYFVEVDSTSRVPKFLASNYPKRTRARLMEFRQPSEEFDLYAKLHKKIYDQVKGGLRPGEVPERDPLPQADGRVTGDDDWFIAPLSVAADNAAVKRRVRVLSENVLALVILPRLSPTDEQARRDNKTTPRDRILLTPDYTYHSKQLTNYTGAKYRQPPPASSREGALEAEINPKNQLPPVVQVAMFAIDETSAQRLAETNNTSDLGIQDLFRDDKSGGNARLFTDAAKLESDGLNPGDLQKFEDKLIAKKLSYRLFSTNVAIRGAKWSKAQLK
jgi:uncharacterized protein (TIGR02599 family)